MANSAPLVSIGIPTFNRATSLTRAVRSASSQDYENLEVLVSDNASTDSTDVLCGKLCKEDERIRYIRQQTNRGAIANFREVLSQARGEYFMWLADDDWLDPTYVSDCARVLMGKAEYVLVCGKDRYYRGDEFVFEGPKINLDQNSPNDRVVHYLQNVSINGMFFGLMRRELLSTLVISPLLGGDWLLMSAIAYSGKTRTLETVSINRSATGGSENLEALALRMGLTPRHARNPHFVIAKSIFVELGWRSPTYRSLGKASRLLMATQSSWAVFARYCLPLYQSRADAVATNLRRWLGRLLDRHLLWRFRKRP